MRSAPGGSASVATAVAASTVLTSLVAVPMGVSAVDAASDPVEFAMGIEQSDARFPEAIDLSASELAIAATDTTQPTAVGEATPTPMPRVEDDQGDNELAVAIATPTAPPTAALATPTPDSVPQPSAPTPAPTPALPSPTPQPPPEERPEPTARPTPSPEAPTPESTPTPRPRVAPTEPSPTPVRPSPTPEPTETPSPDAEPTPTLPVGTETDVYAFISTEGHLAEDTPGQVLVKAVNIGYETTTGLVMQVTVSGGDVLSVSPDPAGWTCTGGGASWECRGPRLVGREAGRHVVNVMPGDDDIVVSVSISHALPDPDPGNNSASHTLDVRDDDDDDDDSDSDDDSDDG